MIGFDHMLFPFPRPLFDSSHMITDESNTNPAGGELTTNLQPGSLIKKMVKPSANQRPGMKIDVIEEKQRYVVTAEVPGFNKEDLKVSIDDNNILSISGEKKHEVKEEDKERRFLRLERSYGFTSRSLRLPRGVHAGEMSAKFENGVLKLCIPRSSEEPKNVTSILIQ